MSEEVPRSDASIPLVRRAVSERAASIFAEETVRDIALVASEMVTNAVRYGTGDRVRVAMRIRDGEFVLSVGNEVEHVRPPPPDEWRIPGPEALAGRGLGIVRRLAPHVGIDQGAHDVTIAASWPVPAGGHR